MFAFVRVTFDFSHLPRNTVNLTLDTFIQFPQRTQTVLNVTGGDIALTTFEGNDNITL